MQRIQDTVYLHITGGIRQHDGDYVRDKCTEFPEAVGLTHPQKSTGDRLLHEAAQEGLVNLANILLEANADIQAVNNEGRTALHIAAACGKKDVLQVLSNDAYPSVNAWDVESSNPFLEFSDENKSCLRPGRASNNPAAFALVPDKVSKFTVTVTESSKSRNYLSIGVCTMSMPNAASSGGFGNTSNSWGLMDYSGAANDNAYFSVNRQKVKNAPRKLDVGDVISCVLNLEKQYVEIYVNEYEFSHVFKAPKSSLIPSGSPYDYYYGVVFASDYRLNICKGYSFIDKGDNNGNTALHLAAENGHNLAVAELIALGCRTDIENNDGQTALALAEKNNHAAIVELLRDELLLPEFLDPQQNGVWETELEIAIKKRQVQRVCNLLFKGVSWKSVVSKFGNNNAQLVQFISKAFINDLNALLCQSASVWNAIISLDNIQETVQNYLEKFPELLDAKDKDTGALLSSNSAVSNRGAFYAVQLSLMKQNVKFLESQLAAKEKSLTDITIEKDKKIAELTANIELLNLRLIDSIVGAESILWYRIDCGNLKVPIKEEPSKTSKTCEHVRNGDEIAVHRTIVGGFQQMVSKHGWIFMNLTNVSWIPIEAPPLVTNDCTPVYWYRNQVSLERARRLSEISTSGAGYVNANGEHVITSALAQTVGFTDKNADILASLNG